MNNHGAPPVGKALAIACPRCFASPGEKCRDGRETCPPHVERGRMARWAQMGLNAETV